MIRDTADMFKEPQRGLFGENEERRRPGSGPRVTGASDLHVFKVQLKMDKPASIAIMDPAKPGSWIWLPKSQIEFENAAAGLIVVTVPEWLARDKGLL